MLEGDRRQETGGRRQETGTRKTEDRRQNRGSQPSFFKRAESGDGNLRERDGPCEGREGKEEGGDEAVATSPSQDGTASLPDVVHG